MKRTTIKKAKRWAKLKQHLIHIGLTIVPYLPIVGCFILFDFLFGTKYETVLIKLLAAVGVFCICLVLWWISSTLIMITDHRIKQKKKEKDKEEESEEIYD